jgi:hypothetical protein
MNKFFGFFAALLCALLVTACGGGGGNPGTVPNQPIPTPSSTVASLVITTSSNTIVSSGVAGSEVTVTALALDANKNAVPGATVRLSVDSGAITLTTATGGVAGVTDASGTISGKLSIAGNSALRAIIISASSGSITATPKTVNVITATPSLSIISSSDTLQSSGAPGSEVTISVLVKDASNSVIQGATVILTADSGAIVQAVKTTDANGMVTGKLSTGNDASVRTITVTATLDPSSGTSAPATKKINVITAVPTLQLTASSGTLDSAGIVGSEVTVFALVRDAGNNVVSGTPVTFSADSGALTVVNGSTDAKGMASAKLSTAGDPTSRVITVTARVAGTPSAITMVNIQGTKIGINANNTVNTGVASSVTAMVTSSSGAPFVNQAVSYSALHGTLLTATGNVAGSSTTNGTGQVLLTYTASPGFTSDTITVKSLGVTFTRDIGINTSNFYVKGVSGNTDLTQANITDCNAVRIHNDIGGVPTNGTVNLSVSRGAAYQDAGCATPLTTSLNLVSGDATAYVRAISPGVSTLVATLLTPVSATAQGTLEFVAPLKSTATINLQADPGVVGSNSAPSIDQQAVLRAVVRDGPITNNVVKGAIVNFSIVSDSSGGYLTQPSVVLTGADGVATVNYVAGPGTSATNGVIIKAQIQSGISSVSTTATLTVAKRALFISAGTGNSIASPNPQTYQSDYSVFVTDAAGNAVSGATITASILPVNYNKGFLVFQNGSWSPKVTVPPAAQSYFVCPNEDTNHDGILQPDEDDATSIIGNGNGNGRLDPGIPLTVTSTGKTDANGTATVSVLYAKDQTNWLEVNMTIRATVAGSEAAYLAHFILNGTAADFSHQDIGPPGQVSPYGLNPCRTPN